MICVSIVFLGHDSFSNVAYQITFFFFNDPATTEIYTLSLHDALPTSAGTFRRCWMPLVCPRYSAIEPGDRKSTRLNSSHANISYAVFCLKKKIASSLCR